MPAQKKNNKLFDVLSCSIRYVKNDTQRHRGCHCAELVCFNLHSENIHFNDILFHKRSTFKICIQSALRRKAKKLVTTKTNETDHYRKQNNLFWYTFSLVKRMSLENTSSTVRKSGNLKKSCTGSSGSQKEQLKIHGKGGWVRKRQKIQLSNYWVGHKPVLKPTLLYREKGVVSQAGLWFEVESLTISPFSTPT